MKTILFVHQSAEMYGSDKVLLFIVERLLEVGRYSVIVVLPTRGPLYNVLHELGAEVHVAEIAKVQRSVFSLVGFYKVVLQCRRAIKQYDEIVLGRNIVCVHSNTLAVLAGAIWAKLRGVKHVWHVHEIILSPRIVSRLFPRLVSALSSKVVSNSVATNDWLVKEAPATASRNVVVFNGLPTVRSPEPDAIEAFRARVGAAKGDVVFTLAGRINRWKGQGLLVESVGLLKRAGKLSSACRFVFVGDAAPGLESLVADLKSRVAELELEDHFIFISFVNDIWPVWFASDVCLVPSTEPEPFGMVAIEAMAAGVPVIAAQHGGLLDIVEEGRTGLLFQPCDANALAAVIEKLGCSRSLREELGARGKKRQLDLFSIDAQVQKLSEIYDQISM